jgi:ATP-dependent Clp protease ATP-binding subunit ClpC
MREATSTSVDLPLSNECKRVLTFAAEEAVRLSHTHIGTEHLLLGLLREEKCFAAEMLGERGLRLGAVREELGQTPHPSAEPNPSGAAPLSDLFRDLTQAAQDGQIEPLIGRDLELGSIIEICGSRHKKNPLLIGEPGAGKTAIVEGLAQRIAEGKVPSFLKGRRILAIDPEQIGGWPRDRQRFEALTKLMSAPATPSGVILFLDEFLDLFASTTRFGVSDVARIIRQALLSEGVSCIATGNASDYGKPTNAWFTDFFRTVHVRPLDAEGTLPVLEARKSRLEKFHEVTYTEEALELAAHASGSYLPQTSLPGKAIELLDAAGSLVKLRKVAPPAEIADAEERITSLIHRMENAIANHEFEKARYYSDEERKERENLGVLREKHPPQGSSSVVVGPDDIKAVISKWAAYPYCP